MVSVICVVIRASSVCFCCFLLSFADVCVVCLSMETKSRAVCRPDGEPMLEDGGSVSTVPDVGLETPHPPSVSGLWFCQLSTLWKPLTLLHGYRWFGYL